MQSEKPRHNALQEQTVKGFTAARPIRQSALLYVRSQQRSNPSEEANCKILLSAVQRKNPRIPTYAIARLHDNIREDKTTRDITLELAHFSVGLADIEGTSSCDEINIRSERKCKVPNVEEV